MQEHSARQSLRKGFVVAPSVQELVDPNRHARSPQRPTLPLRSYTDP